MRSNQRQRSNPGFHQLPYLCIKYESHNDRNHLSQTGKSLSSHWHCHIFIAPNADVHGQVGIKVLGQHDGQGQDVTSDVTSNHHQTHDPRIVLIVHGLRFLLQGLVPIYRQIEWWCLDRLMKKEPDHGYPSHQSIANRCWWWQSHACNDTWPYVALVQSRVGQLNHRRANRSQAVQDQQDQNGLLGLNLSPDVNKTDGVG